MASELRVDTIKTADGSTASIETSFVAGGSAKVWANYQQSSSHTLRDSLNVDSLGDLCAGQTQINFTTNFAKMFSNTNFSSTSTGDATYCQIVLHGDLA